MVTYLLPTMILLHFTIIGMTILGIGMTGFVNTKKRTAVFIGYRITLISLIIIFIIVFFPFPVVPSEIESNIKNELGQVNNLVPFKSIIGYIKSAVNGYTSVFWYQLIGNIIIFVPYGFSLNILLFKTQRSFFKTILICIITSLSIEIIQGIYSIMLGYTYRSMDFDDLLLNTIGGMAGYFTTMFLYHFLFPKSKEKKHTYTSDES